MRCSDVLATALIRIGGRLALASLVSVIVVLVGRSLPLLSQANLTVDYHLPAVRYQIVGVVQESPVARSLLTKPSAEDPNEGTESGWWWGLTHDGRLEVRDLANGTVLDSLDLPDPQNAGDSDTDSAELTATCVTPSGRAIGLGYSDGSLQVLHLVGSPHAASSVQMQSSGELATSGDAIRCIDLLELPSGESQFLAASKERLWLCQPRSSDSPLELRHEFAMRQRTPVGPLAVMLAASGGQAMVAWEQGFIDLVDFTLSPPQSVASQSSLLLQSAFTAAQPVHGHHSLLCGTSDGELLVWSILSPDATLENLATAPRLRLRLTHRLQLGEQAIRALAVAHDDRLAVAWDAGQTASLVQLTTDQLLLERPIAQVVPNRALLSGEHLLMLGEQQALSGILHAPYPQLSTRGLFAKIWYEGDELPSFDWQPSVKPQSEARVSLVPLIFGALKAAVLAMLFSLPVGGLAAVYTSEFLPSHMRYRIKPTLELMASLPSVVIGYMAATIAAPFLETNLLALLLTIVLSPLALILAGKLWCSLPTKWRAADVSWKLYCMLACFPMTYLLAGVLAGPLQAQLYNGDFVVWLGTSNGSAVGGWLLVCLPCALTIAGVVYLGRQSDRTARSGTRPRAAILPSLLQSSLRVLLILGACYAVSSLLAQLGLDLRDGWLHGYQAQNSLLLGFALGFCLIPVIFTLTHDALQAVPQGLREASFACGATRLQTTIRVVLPLATSGILGATLISFSRAVGETMLVLTVVGNSPLMSWSPFDGLQSLAGALGSELPHAAPGSSHFQALLLGALALFAFTFVLNAIGDWARIRFRRRIQEI